jgi:hypothetical protein
VCLHQDEYGWAVSIGAISLLLSLCLAAIVKFAPGMETGLPCQCVVVFLFVGWFCGMAVCTMQAPFVVAQNGWYATWLCLIASGALLFETNPFNLATTATAFYPTDDTTKYIAGVFFASFIEMWHAAVKCDNDAYCEGMVAYAVAAGVVPMILIIMFMAVVVLRPMIQFLALFLALWWVCVVLALTMPGDADCDAKNTYCNGVFIVTENGFVACWAGMLFSCLLAATTSGLTTPAAEEGASPGDPGKEPGDVPAYLHEPTMGVGAEGSAVKDEVHV